MTSSETNHLIIWKEPVVMWGMLAASLGLLIFVALPGMLSMVGTWETREEYSHGYIIPFITLFLIWQKNDYLTRLEFSGSWAGVSVLIFALAIIFLGLIGAISTIVQYGFLLAVLGVSFAFLGWQALKLVIVPLLILGFMIPLPGFILQGLSSELQLISSQIGVAVIRLFDISVYLEGNVIDLGTYKLQVVEACSGLNYLFPLMSLAFVAAYFYNAPFWKRAIIFLSSIPVTILMNSFRIGVIGMLVENWGPSQAEGFLHDFEGWVIFMACLSILVAEMWLLNKIGSDNKPLSEVFGLEFPEPAPDDAVVKVRPISKQLIAVVIVLVMAAAGAFSLGQNENIIPKRSMFTAFPLEMGEWKGKQGFLEQIYLDALKLDDYIINDYVDSEGGSVNFYSAYYEQQRAGASAHSPRTCIPGGGWRINSLEPKVIEGVSSGTEPLTVNRLVIKKGDHAQVVYYWFKMRERNVSNEYMVKFYLFWDAVTRNRTDLALIRFTSVSNPGEDLNKADERIQSLIRGVYPKLSKYIPE